MGIDQNDPVVKLCAAGINEEIAGNANEAAGLYLEAWEQCDNDFNRSIVAHYMARVQPDAEARLMWNLRSLSFADTCPAEVVTAFYPSLYLNVGKSYEDLGNSEEALKNYQLADSASHALPDDKLGNITREGIKNGLYRMMHRQ